MTKVHCLGYRGVGSQIDRIEAGFAALGVEVTPYISEADLIYSNDSGGFDQVIRDKANGVIKGKVIFNQLDLAPHCPDFPLAKIREQLTHADAITTISQTVKRDLAARAGVEATIVYNPIRGVSRNRLPTKYKGMFVGRVADPEKRSTIGAAALAILGYGWDDVITVGREQPPYGGVYWGTATDEVLSQLYNQTDFLMCPTRNAFLGLPILEAMACGTIPVVCNDLDILDEFLPVEVFPEYREVDPTPPAIARFMARCMQEGAKEEFAQRVYTHYMVNWQERLSPRGVAQSILNVYQAL